MNAMSSWPFKCACPVATTASGFALDQVIHDRQIVRRQVPDHVDVVLEQAEIDAHRIVVIKIAQHPSSTSWRIFRTAPVNRNVWSTMICRFFCSAISISSSACAALEVNGFSTNTCLPFSSAAFASS